MITWAIYTENAGMDVIHPQFLCCLRCLLIHQYLILSIFRYRMTLLFLFHPAITDPIFCLRAGKQETAAAKSRRCIKSLNSVTNVLFLQLYILSLVTACAVPA